WHPGPIGQDQVVFFRKTFELPADIAGFKAQFWGSCDNVLNANVNDASLGFSTEWSSPVFHAITQHLKPGKNVVMLRGTNQGGVAGLIARITITTANGTKSYVVTDNTWKVQDITTFTKDDPRNKDLTSPKTD